jgi:hypothetical protein
MDHEDRVLTYQATPPPSNDGLPRGIVSFDGSLAEVGGAGKSLAKDAGASFAQFKRIERRLDGTVHLQVAGPRDYLCTLEASSDLVHWTELAPIFLPDGEVDYQDQAVASHQQRFYRTR